MFLTADDAQRIWRSQTQCQFQLCYAAAATVAAASVTVVAVADSIATTAATMFTTMVLSGTPLSAISTCDSCPPHPKP